MCGILGIFSKLKTNNIFYDLFEGLYHLQHRGQDSYGIAVLQNNQKYNIIKHKGLLLDKKIPPLNGYIGLGHVRYPTNGENTIKEAQPFIKKGLHHDILLVHNGQVWKTEKLIQYFKANKISINTKTDTELILNLLSFELNKYKKLTNEIIKQITYHISTILEGSYSCICIIPNFGMVVFKDKYGIRPLILGFNKESKTYIISSESVSLTGIDYTIIKDIYNETIIFRDNEPSFTTYNNLFKTFSPCIFEWIYLAREESVLYDVPVYLTRMEIGKTLAKRIKNLIDINIIDYIIPIPKTSKPAALAISNELKIPYIEAIVKNRYINRTFIMDSQNKRQKNIKRKLNVIQHFIQNKTIMIVDDSIVRGNTMKHIIQLLKKNKVKDIYVVSCSPEIIYGNRYGIDIPSREELIAYNKTVKEMEDFYKVKKLIFHNLEDIKKCIQKFNPKIKQFETSIFTN
tara:strand:- start:855 stop:2228 length:1374 start_codon:yes stop_codon:yes gene_type:complete